MMTRLALTYDRLAKFAALREASDGNVPPTQRQLKTPKSTILGRRVPQPPATYATRNR